MMPVYDAHDVCNLSFVLWDTHVCHLIITMAIISVLCGHGGQSGSHQDEKYQLSSGTTE